MWHRTKNVLNSFDKQKNFVFHAEKFLMRLDFHFYRIRFDSTAQNGKMIIFYLINI